MSKTIYSHNSKHQECINEHITIGIQVKSTIYIYTHNIWLQELVVCVQMNKNQLLPNLIC
jgi:hypothetical protein